MVKIRTIIAFVAVVCVAAVGFVIFYNPHRVTALDVSEVVIEAEPVALGAETLYNSELELICEGNGSIEVSPYKSSYSMGEYVTFTAQPLDGWGFDHWEGDTSNENTSRDTLSLRMPEGPVRIIAVFNQE